MGYQLAMLSIISKDKRTTVIPNVSFLSFFSTFIVLVKYYAPLSLAGSLGLNKQTS